MMNVSKRIITNDVRVLITFMIVLYQLHIPMEDGGHHDSSGLWKYHPSGDMATAIARALSTPDFTREV